MHVTPLGICFKWGESLASCPAVQSERLLLSAGALPKDRVRLPPSPAQQTCLWSLWIAVSRYQFQYQAVSGMGKRFCLQLERGQRLCYEPCWARDVGQELWQHGLLPVLGLTAQALGSHRGPAALQALPCGHWAAWVQLMGPSRRGDWLRAAKGYAAEVAQAPIPWHTAGDLKRMLFKAPVPRLHKCALTRGCFSNFKGLLGLAQCLTGWVHNPSLLVMCSNHVWFFWYAMFS